MRATVLAVVVICATGSAGVAAAARSVSHDEYENLLRQANARVTRVEVPIERAFGSKTTTVPDLRKLLLASASVSTAIGHEFSRVQPPEPAAQRAGRLLSRGELDLGAETRALALRVPATKAAALSFLQRQHPRGGPEVDHALSALNAAGYRTG